MAVSSACKNEERRERAEYLKKDEEDVRKNEAISFGDDSGSNVGEDEADPEEAEADDKAEGGRDDFDLEEQRPISLSSGVVTREDRDARQEAPIPCGERNGEEYKDKNASGDFRSRPPPLNLNQLQLQQLQIYRAQVLSQQQQEQEQPKHSGIPRSTGKLDQKLASAVYDGGSSLHTPPLHGTSCLSTCNNSSRYAQHASSPLNEYTPSQVFSTSNAALPFQVLSPDLIQQDMSPIVCSPTPSSSVRSVRTTKPSFEAVAVCEGAFTGEQGILPNVNGTTSGVINGGSSVVPPYMDNGNAVSSDLCASGGDSERRVGSRPQRPPGAPGAGTLQPSARLVNRKMQGCTLSSFINSFFFRVSVALWYIYIYISYVCAFHARILWENIARLFFFESHNLF